MQKWVDFYNKKGKHILKDGCTLANLVKISLHKSTTAKFQPVKKSEKELLEKVHEDKFGETSIFIARKAVMNEIPVRDSTNWSKSMLELMLVSFIPFLCVKHCL